MHEKRIEIRWRDLDALGHVNNAVYLSYLEEVRTQWLAHVLGGHETVWSWVLVRVAIDYRRELSLDDGAVIARCRLSRIGTSSVRTEEEIVTEAGEVAARAEAVVAARNADSTSSRPLTEEERVAFAAVEGDIDLTGFRVEAADGEVGTVDKATREAHGGFVVLDPDPRFFAKKLMLSAEAIESVDAETQTVRVGWTKEQIKYAPQVEEAPDEGAQAEAAAYYDHELTPYTDKGLP